MSILNETMRAVVWQGNAYNVAVVDLPMPIIINQTDAIVRMSTAAICGSDLHIYRGTNSGPPVPWTLGHEGVGYVSQVGAGVGSLSVGDPVIVPFNLAEGHIHTGLTTMMYGGYGNGGDLGGTQAEYLRVPFADEGLIPVPSFNYTDSTTNQTLSLENDYVMLSDILATGWAALDFAGFQPGDTIAVFGSGPIMAREPSGMTRSVDCVGYEQVNRNLTVQPDVIINNMMAVTSTGGGMGTVGVYNRPASNSTVAPRAGTIRNPVPFSLADFFFGEFTWGAGPSNPIDLAPQLVQLVASRRITPGFIVEDEISIEDAPDAYARFERHETTKVVIKFD
ncbi:hypothetical protein LTR15_009835 [Elasticomyces elasticus]|nr:hypothetical protein LTR15_009835 [Elasticomyces elasticus]